MGGVAVGWALRDEQPTYMPTHQSLESGNHWHSEGKVSVDMANGDIKVHLHCFSACNIITHYDWLS
jgi:hypothetical protein